MTEPDVTLTDYLLTLICTGLAWYLYIDSGQKTLLLKIWILFFLSAAVASLLGGTVHGFYSDPTTLTYQLFWKATLLAIGVTSTSCWILGGFFLNGRNQLSNWILFAVILFVIYTGIVIFYSQNFVVAIINYLPAIMFMLIVMIFLFLKKKGRDFLWIIIGILISLMAAIVQQTKFSLHHEFFNFNSTYHLLQAIGFCFIFKGARGLVKSERGFQ